MSGEIATAYIALVPSMKGFGAAAARQIGPQATQVGTRAGKQAGVAFTTAASKESAGWFAQTAAGAIKNVTLYGSMYAIITNVQAGIGQMFDSMVGFNGQIEQATIGFETMLGTASAARDQMAWIQEFAKETPFQYEDLVGYSQQLLALGFSAEQSREVLQATGDAAAALGRGSESIARINLALGQMWTKGKVQSQEMLQLTEAGISAWQILAEAYGVSVAEVQEAVTDGLVKASDAVPALLAGMNARYGGLMEEQSKTFVGIVSNIQDTLQQELAGAGEPLFAVLKVQAEQFLEALDDPEVIDMMSDLGQFLADGATALATAGELAWKYRDAIITVGIAYAATQLLQRVPVGSPLSAATWYNAARAQEAYAAGLRRTTALRAGLTSQGSAALGNAAQVGGMIALVDGYRRVSEAAGEGEASALGFAEAIGGGAIAGAALGSVIPGLGTAAGAAAGAVAGLATSVWSYQAAIDAANSDTSTLQEAFQSLGVDAALAQLALDGVTNSQLEAAGGANALIDAMKSGTYVEYADAIQAQVDALREQADAAQYAAVMAEGVDYAKALDASIDLTEQYTELNGLLEALRANGDAFAAASESLVASQYESAFAADTATGALGTMTEQAWNAVMAQGGLGNEALIAAARMEGLAGTAGYATQMITGIPANTPINFTTNAAEIMSQIVGLQASMDAIANRSGDGSLTVNSASRIKSMQDEVAALQEQYRDAVSSVTATLTLPTKSTSGGSTPLGRSVTKAVSDAAEEAARKLEQDRTAQIRFGDAFGSLMSSALEGDFEDYREKLQEQITSLVRDGYFKAAKALKNNSQALTRAARDYAALTNKLETATDAYDDLTAAMQDQYTMSRDLITGLGQVTDAQSFDQLAYLLGETTNRATEYQNVLTQLKNQGLSEDLWNQLANAGPQSMALAQSILAQGDTGIEQLNALSDGLVGAAESMGSLVSDAMYGQGVDAMKKYIAGLESQSTALDAQLTTIANNVLNKTAGAITPGNAGYSQISSGMTTTANNYVNVTIDAGDLDDLSKIQDFLKMLEQAPTTQLVNQAGTVTS